MFFALTAVLQIAYGLCSIHTELRALQQLEALVDCLPGPVLNDAWADRFMGSGFGMPSL
ncbi:hypothetical protein SynA1528_02591 [Synechococcus sp. A15-28]|nr:hypothetical protein SynA1528_02591 [Synechococcus sp. A15-28]